MSEFSSFFYTNYFYYSIVDLQCCVCFRCTTKYVGYTYVCVRSHWSCVLLFVTLWTVALQAPLSMGFSRLEYWSGLPFPPPRDPHFLRLLHCMVDSLPLSHWGSPKYPHCQQFLNPKDGPVWWAWTLQRIWTSVLGTASIFWDFLDLGWDGRVQEQIRGFGAR